MERSARAAGEYGIVEDYVGHGIGSEMHMDPPVPNYGRPGRGPVLAEGMALAIEPLLVLGSPETRLLDDGWTVVSEDGGWSAHFEHTVAITAAGPWVLTAPAGRARPVPSRPARCIVRAAGGTRQATASGRLRRRAGWPVTPGSAPPTRTATGRPRCCASTTRPAG